jgi:membrane-bound lytic murein transglycosylase B
LASARGRQAPTGPDRAALVLPAGTRGPAFLVFANFNAIHKYNNSQSYALAIAHLADRFSAAGHRRGVADGRTHAFCARAG